MKNISNPSIENTEKFKNRYRIKSARLSGYDYSQNGSYFVTICTKNREHFFGEIKNGKMNLSEMGEIISEEWENTEKIRKNVELGAWVIMPNHFHGILIIQNDDKTVETPRRGVSTDKLQRNPNHKPEWKPGCLGAIINQFKSVCTKKIRTFYPLFGWQTRFHDHIIRSEKELNRISEYIMYNPEKWEDDCFF
jgi:REP element-mobilizing transposase RayT